MKDIKGQEKLLHDNTNQQKILMSYKGDFRRRNFPKDKSGHYRKVIGQLLKKIQ